jgi:hypothetical protein
MKLIKRTYFMVLGPIFVIFQRRKQIFINFDGINLFLFTFFATTMKRRFMLHK